MTESTEADDDGVYPIQYMKSLYFSVYDGAVVYAFVFENMRLA